MAPRGKTTQLHNMYVADFETCDADEVYTYDTQTGDPIHYQRVWLAGYKNLETMESSYFTSIDDFMEDILSRGENTNTEYAFHNIKFDGSYIVPWLFKNGYEVTHAKPQPKEFSILVDNRNNWYSINIQVTKRRRVLLWDSVKLFPTSLEYLPDVYSTPTKKVREDQDWYEEKRPTGYQPNERDMRYFENDLQVPAEALNKHIELYGLRFKKTQASQSFYNFEQTFKAWKWRFPALTDQEDEAIRSAYWGGISHVPPEKAGKDFYNIGSYDINSSYPDKAANFKLPYGHCVSEYGEDKHPDMSKFWVAEALVEFKLKPHHLPCIPKKAISEGELLERRELVIDKWVDDSHGIVKMKFSSIDYQTMSESYELTIWRWCWSMHWAWKKHREVAKFVNTNNERKVKYSALARIETDPQKKIEYNTIRNRAKIDNNSFYGKFGEEVIKEGKTPYLVEDDEGREDIEWIVDREEVQSERSRKYLPVAIAITAWGRQQLVRGANILGEHFLYCDTDSLHFLKEGEYKLDQANKEGHFYKHPEELGAWDYEGTYTRGRYLRAKCYMEETPEGERLATVAGLPADKHSGQFSKKRSCLNWDNFHLGTVIHQEQTNKLRTLRTPTGNKLLPVAFEIKRKDTINTVPTKEQEMKIMLQWQKQIEKENDPFRMAVQEYGFIKTVKQGEQFYYEYKELSRSTKAKYFRRDGLPLDIFADEMGLSTNELIDKLGGY